MAGLGPGSCATSSMQRLGGGGVREGGHITYHIVDKTTNINAR